MSRKLLHTPEGVRDIYGREYAGKLFVEQKIHDDNSGYGYEHIHTHTFENNDADSYTHLRDHET